MGVAEYFPYGKLFISPLLGLLWPETAPAKNQFDAILDQAAAMMDKKLEDYNIKGIKSQIIPLKTEIETLERLVNNNNGPNGLFSAGTPEESARATAKGLQKAFHDLMSACDRDQGGTLSVAELPLYTTVATLHLLFLDFIKENQHKDSLQIDQTTFDSVYAVDNDASQRYQKHIKETYEKANKALEDKMNAIQANSSSNPQQTLDALKSKMNSLQSTVDAMTSGEDNKHTPAISLGTMKTRLADAKDKYNNYKDLLDKKNDYTASTINNEAFLTAAAGIAPAGTLSGWQKKDNKYYFFAPYNDYKNSDGTTFKRGDMVTGWITSDDGKYYLLAPNDGFKNTNNDTANEVSFKTGEMVTGWVQWNNAWYYLNDIEKYGNIGHALIGNQSERAGDPYNLKDRSGKTKRYVFDNNGAMKN